MKTVFFMAFACLLLSASETTQQSLTITVKNIQAIKGNMRIGIYKSTSDFPNEKDVYAQRIYKINKTGSILIKINDLPYGEYAIGIYQDKNKNGTLDKNFVGIPKESFAFSNNIKPRFGPPSFKDCAFNYSATNHKMSVTLLNY